MGRKVLMVGLLILVGTFTGAAMLTVTMEGRVLPGVKVAGIEVGGNYPETAEKILREKIQEGREIIFRYQDRDWVKKLTDWNLKVNYRHTVDRALQVGRGEGITKNLWNRILVAKNGYWVDPVAVWDETRLIAEMEKIASEIEIPPMDPQIELDRYNKVVINPGQNGVRVDRELLLARIKNSFFGQGTIVIEVPAEEIKPALSGTQTIEASARAQKMVGKRLEVKNGENKQVWLVDDKQILFWMNLAAAGWKNEQIVEWLNELAPSVNKLPQNASFTFVTETKLEGFKPEVWGRALNTPGSYEKIIEALSQLEGGEKKAVADLVLVKIAPEVSLGEVNNLGLVERLGKGESWFSGSITNRIYNLKKASTELSGIIVPPGKIFSFNENIGEVSANTGYKQAYVIKEGKTVLGDGGGVCQVSSTLFRAVLAAGLPVIERTPHAYRVHYYEEKYEPGFDATVFQPNPDFKFENDTPAYLLIQMVYDEKAKYLAFEIYGTSDGRRVELSKARIWDQTPPPPDLYVDDPTLPVGQVKQTEHAAWGAKAAFDYKVFRGEEILQNRTFVSVYRPWQAVYLRGIKPL